MGDEKKTARDYFDEEPESEEKKLEMEQYNQIIRAMVAGIKPANLTREETKKRMKNVHISIDHPYIKKNNTTDVSPAAVYIAQSMAAKTKAYNDFFHSFRGKVRLRMSFDSCSKEQASVTKYCYHCCKKYPISSKFCGECGKNLPDKTIAEIATCSACGETNSFMALSCEKCGEKLYPSYVLDEIHAEMDIKFRVWWQEAFPKYPFWDTAKYIDSISRYDMKNGGIYYIFFYRDDNTDYAEPMAYRDLLLENGFEQYDENPGRVFLKLAADGTDYYISIFKPSSQMSVYTGVYISTGEPVEPRD